MNLPKPSTAGSHAAERGESQSTQQDLAAKVFSRQSSQEPEPDIAAELEVAGYVDADEIGRGGFGVVYRCTEESLRRGVAVKVLSGRLDADNLDRFLREEQAMGTLSGHPNIADILHVDITRTGRPFIVMPYHERGCLDEMIRNDGPISWELGIRFGVKLAGAVETAHRAGILHRDVKPANVLLTAYGEPQLTDFGVARVVGCFETSAGTITGSPAYTAPEVLKGESPTPRSDVYGLGATLFAAITGHAAFERKQGEKVVTQFLRITTEPVPDLREHGIPADVATAIETAMATDPADRPDSAQAFGELLRTIQAEHGMNVDDMALLGLPPDTPIRRSGRISPVDAPRTLPPPGASARYRPAEAERAALPRERLLRVLRTEASRKLTVIHGPSGTGKATLAAQWRSELTADGVVVAWLRVDDGDNDPVWFLAHLIEAITRADSDFGIDICGVDSLEDEQSLLSGLTDRLHDRPERLVVVLDDWHRIVSAATHHVLERLLDDGGDRLRLVVVGANRSGLPLSRMRVRDELVEIDWQALQLDLDETRELLLERHRLDFSEVAVSVLHAATEGWAAALQLAAQSLAAHVGRDSAEAGEVIGGITARRIDEYIADNVIAGVEPKMVEFLMSIAVTERVTGDLASVLAQVPDGQAMLEEAEERDLFLSRVDSDPQWFRLHPLFAEYLRRRCRREHPELPRVLHLHASEWFAARQLMDEAVDHALAAADPDRATAVIVEDDAVGNDRSRMATLLGMLSKLPSQGVIPRSKLMMAAARAQLALQQSETMRAARRRLHRSRDDNGDIGF